MAAVLTNSVWSSEFDRADRARKITNNGSADKAGFGKVALTTVVPSDLRLQARRGEWQGATRRSPGRARHRASSGRLRSPVRAGAGPGRRGRHNERATRGSPAGKSERIHGGEKWLDAHHRAVVEHSPRRSSGGVLGQPPGKNPGNGAEYPAASGLPGSAGRRQEQAVKAKYDLDMRVQVVPSSPTGLGAVHVQRGCLVVEPVVRQVGVLGLALREVVVALAVRVGVVEPYRTEGVVLHRAGAVVDRA